MRLPESQVGRVYGKLVVIKNNGLKKGRTHWLCECKCGNTRSIRTSNLQSSSSCGCRRKEKGNTYSQTHGGSYTRLYSIWAGIIQRSTNKRSKDYGNYGARGVKIYEPWLNFSGFRSDMGPSYEAHCSLYGERQTTIERADNNGDYNPDNCRWATKKEQSRNTRHNKMIEINNDRKCLSEWLEEKKICQDTYKRRVRNGWSPEEAITTPIDTRFSKKKRL